MVVVNWHLWSSLVMQRNAHLLPLVSLFVVLAGILVLTQVQLQGHAWYATAVIGIYFVSNISYTIHKKTFTLHRLLEIGLISILAQFVTLSFLT